MNPERLAEIRDYITCKPDSHITHRHIQELLAAYEAQAQKLSNSDATIEGLADELAAARASYTELDHRNDELAFYNATAFRQAEELRGALAEARDEYIRREASIISEMKHADAAEAALAKAREALKAKSGLVLEANRKLEEWRAIAKERGERNDLNEANLRTLGVQLAEARARVRE